MAGGSRGSCKICSSPLASQINGLIAAGRNEGQVKRAVREVDPTIYWARPTYYAHKEHITHPLITAVELARKNPIVVPKTNRGALEMVRDVGMARIANDPSLITPDHVLKSLSIMESSKRPVENIWIVLAKLMNQGTPEESSEVIVGEYHEVQEEEVFNDPA